MGGKLEGLKQGNGDKYLITDATLDILRPWETAKLADLTRKVIHRLSRLNASGVFSGHAYQSVWGEYSHHIQKGDFDDFSDLLDDLAADACEAVADGVPNHELLLFKHLAVASGEDEEMTGYIYLIEQLKVLLSTKASLRDLDRYSDEYRWYDNL